MFAPDTRGAMNTLVPLCAALTLVAAGVAADAPGRLPDAHPSAGLDARPANTCFGGLEDGKHLLQETDLFDHAEQTTPSGCAETGGRPGWLPRFNPPIKRLVIG